MVVAAGALRVVLALAALTVVVATGMSAVKTFVVPRAQATRLPRFVFVAVRRLFHLRGRFQHDYHSRDATMAAYAPVALITLPFVSLLVIAICFALVFFALEPRRGLVHAAEISGSSLFTLGTDSPTGPAGKLLGYAEASLGLALLALLITYLPSIYAAFSRREALVGMMEVRAGSPPTAVEMLTRYAVIGWFDRLDGMWHQWEQWFVEVEESHTSLAALPFFRSPQPDHSWVTAAGCVLDAAALTASTLDLGGRQPDAELCVRAGFVCLRRIAEFFQIPFDPDPAPTDPIALTREEFDQAYDELASAGVPVKSDQDRCWADFAGWRVNYDSVLIHLAALVMAPPTPWSSDRAPAFRAPPVLRRRRRRTPG